MICTVGGSHEPVLTAIRETSPDFICFVCSADDPGTGRSGSHRQVTGRGAVIKANPGDSHDTLPNIPIQLGLHDDCFEVLLVQSDDLDDGYRKISGWINTHQTGELELVADYTGGTKTMSAALVLAAVERDDVSIQLVTGNRADLISVQSGAEHAVPASIEHTRLDRAIAYAAANWRVYAYEAAATYLGGVALPRDQVSRARLMMVRDLSAAFADWDRFEHAGAGARLESYRSKLGGEMPQVFNTLKSLTTDAASHEPMQIFDLWRNAERRAARARYDDAVARAYRVLEWSAQWLLSESAGIKTSDVPADRIPPEVRIPPNRQGRYQAGLFAAWELAALYCGPEISTFWESQNTHLLDILKVRNASILAHGAKVVTPADWELFGGWIETELMPLLLGVTGGQKYRIHNLPPQLPTSVVGLEQSRLF